jgi:hypothetical protein
MQIDPRVLIVLVLLIKSKTDVTVNADRARITNPHDFNYIRNPGAHVCSPNHGSDIFLLVYVHSAPANLKNRLAIRESWSQKCLFKPGTMRVVFMMGKADGEKQNSLLDLEYDTFGDIIQEDFYDSYRNLTYKGFELI